MILFWFVGLVSHNNKNPIFFECTLKSEQKVYGFNWMKTLQLNWVVVQVKQDHLIKIQKDQGLRLSYPN